MHIYGMNQHLIYRIYRSGTSNLENVKMNKKPILLQIERYTNFNLVKYFVWQVLDRSGKIYLLCHLAEHMMGILGIALVPEELVSRLFTLKLPTKRYELEVVNDSTVPAEGSFFVG